MDFPVLPKELRLIELDSVRSTNDEAFLLAKRGAAHLTLITAREQTNGRGRRARNWLSCPGNIHMSLIVRPDCRPSEAAKLSFVAGLSVVEALLACGPSGISVSCKWPNDILIENRKVAGILLESDNVTRHDNVEFIIVGIGINVVWAPENIGYPITCLHAEGYGEYSAKQVIEIVACHFLHWISIWYKLGFSAIRTVWLHRAYGIGKPVIVRLINETIEGIFIDMNEQGALILDSQKGQRVITAGDVFFR